MPKVLIVDDDADVRACLQDALEARGLSCWAVENGRHALECLRAAEVDLDVFGRRVRAEDLGVEASDAALALGEFGGERFENLAGRGLDGFPLVGGAVEDQFGAGPP